MFSTTLYCCLSWRHYFISIIGETTISMLSLLCRCFAYFSYFLDVDDVNNGYVAVDYVAMAKHGQYSNLQISMVQFSVSFVQLAIILATNECQLQTIRCRITCWRHLRVHLNKALNTHTYTLTNIHANTKIMNLFKIKWRQNCRKQG